MDYSDRLVMEFEENRAHLRAVVFSGGAKVALQ